MAHFLFGANLLLALSDSRGHGNPDAISINGNVGQQCTQALGKKDHPAGLVDYLGALPVLETDVRAPIPPALSYGRCDPANSLERLSTQLTLFYAGTVNVFDYVTADKAQIVMSLAGNSNKLDATTSSFKMAGAPFIQPSARCSLQLQGPMKKMRPETQGNLTNLSIGERLQISEDGHAQGLESLLVPCQAIVPKALPLARKASLTRFLEERKERVRLMGPYLAKGSAIHQGANHSNASTSQMFYNEIRGDPISAKKLGCASRWDVED